MKSIIAALVGFIILFTFLLAICKANGTNRNDDDEQERYLQNRKKVKK